MKRKITLIGAGQIGGTLAHLIALKELADVAEVEKEIPLEGRRMSIILNSL